MKKVLVIDAQGGGIGRQIITGIREKMPDLDITAVGTNSAATSNMLKAGASRAATGENAVVVMKTSKTLSNKSTFLRIVYTSHYLIIILLKV